LSSSATIAFSFMLCPLIEQPQVFSVDKHSIAPLSC